MCLHHAACSHGGIGVLLGAKECREKRDVAAAGVVLEGGLAAQGLDDVTVGLVPPGGAVLHQAQHSFKVAIGRGGLHRCPGLGVADVGVG